MFFLSVIIFIGIIYFVMMASMGAFNPVWILDLMSLLCILIVAVPLLISSGLTKDFGKAFGLIRTKKEEEPDRKQIRKSLEAVKLTGRLMIYSGILNCLLGGIWVLHSLTDPARLGPNISVCLISILYAIMLTMILLPVEAKLKVMLKDGE